MPTDDWSPKLHRYSRRLRYEGWFLRVLIASLVITAVVQATRPMATYKTLALNGSIGDVGLVAASFGLLSLLVAIPIGRWVDRGRESRFVAVGAAIMSVAVAGAAMVPSIPMLALSQAVLGLGHLAVVVGIQTMIANRGGGQDDRDSRFGAFAVVQSLGQLIGPAAAGLLAANASGVPNADIVFVVAAVAAAGGSLLGLTLARVRGEPGPERAADSQPGERMGPAVRRVLAIPSMRQALLGGITVVVTVNVLIAYLPAYGEASGLSVGVVGLLLAVRAGASMASRLLIGPMRKRMGRRNLLVVCLIGPALALFVFAMASDLGILLLAMLVTGFGLGLGQPLTLSWIAGQAPREIRGTAVAVRVAGNRVGQFAVPASLGLIAGAAGIAGVFWSLGFLLLLSGALVRTGPFVEEARERSTG